MPDFEDDIDDALNGDLEDEDDEEEADDEDEESE